LSRIPGWPDRINAFAAPVFASPGMKGRKRHFLAALFGDGYGIKLDLR
jgi:hypothetical protein